MWACERDGLARHATALAAPPALAALMAAVEAASALPAGVPHDLTPGPTLRGVKPRKRAQLTAFARFAAPLAPRVDRVVDIGAGHGHLTRELCDALTVEGLGVERDPALIEAARRRGAGHPVRFVQHTVGADAPIPLGPRDLVVGLHACGALTDTLSQLAEAVGAAVCWVSCCLHRVPGDARPPRCPPAGVPPEALTWPRDRLGLANLISREQGVEAPLDVILAARTRRTGLRHLLRGRGLAVQPGDEMNGLNRRVAGRPFAELVAAALAHRGLPPASAAECAAAEARGQAAFARERRLSLPRKALGPLIEVYINLERAQWLQARGYAVQVGRLWPAGVSPRNIGCRAWRPDASTASGDLSTLGPPAGPLSG